MLPTALSDRVLDRDGDPAVVLAGQRRRRERTRKYAPRGAAAIICRGQSSWHALQPAAAIIFRSQSSAHTLRSVDTDRGTRTARFWRL
jgi:1,6-anhydro-N-acetylmuramate kinase